MIDWKGSMIPTHKGAKCAKHNGPKGSMMVPRVIWVLVFFQWYYDGTKAACDCAMWLMMVTRVLGWSKVHDDSAKGPMMVTNPYNTLATITKTYMVYHLRSLERPQSPQHHHRTTHTFLAPSSPSFLPWQHHKDLGCSSHHCSHHYKPLGIFTECLTHSQCLWHQYWTISTIMHVQLESSTSNTSHSDAGL